MFNFVRVEMARHSLTKFKRLLKGNYYINNENNNQEQQKVNWMLLFYHILRLNFPYLSVN